MGKPIDLTGQRFGKWTVLGKAVSPPGYEHQNFWHCRCECGTEAARKGGQLRYAEKRGVRQSCQRCGAIDAQTTHGKSKTPEYKVWASMLDRCRNPAHKAYARYGGRGIVVCPQWENFEVFIADMGRRPSDRHSLDRIDNNGPYSPNNCRWATQRTQARNQERNIRLTHNGKTQTVMCWAEETGLSHALILRRIQALGWGVAEALDTPAGPPTNWRGKSHKDAAQYELNGKRQSLSDWAKELGLNTATLYSRIKRGWPLDRALQP